MACNAQVVAEADVSRSHCGNGARPSNSSMGSVSRVTNTGCSPWDSGASVLFASAAIEGPVHLDLVLGSCVGWKVDTEIAVAGSEAVPELLCLLTVCA
jgi:hypothetical protein